MVIECERYVVAVLAETLTGEPSKVSEKICTAKSAVHVRGNVPLKNKCVPAVQVGMVEAVGFALVAPTAI